METPVEVAVIRFQNSVFGKTLQEEMKIQIGRENTGSLEDKFRGILEQIEYDRYQKILKDGLFKGTYHEYKERLKLGPIGLSQKL